MDKPTNTLQPRRPLLLLRNIRYPSYQFWAFAGTHGNRDTVLKIAVLYTMQWLRERFREHELPCELALPPACDYERVDFSHFSNIHLQQGYRLDIMWLPDKKSWSLQLTEPDLGPRPGQASQERMPVPGRIFETNISYQQTAQGVLCGFQTMVSEPEGTETFCEVFRIAVVKHLTRDPLVGLHHIWKLEEKPYIIGTAADVKSFAKRIIQKERILPVIVISEYLPSIESQKPIPTTTAELDNIHLEMGCSRFSGVERHILEYGDTLIKNRIKPVLPPWTDKISHERMSYAHFFVLTASMREMFIKDTGCSITNGGALLLPPPQTAEREMVFSYSEVSDAGFGDRLDNIAANYLKGKALDFSRCLFVPQAQEIYMNNILQSIHSETELKAYYSVQTARLEERHSKHLAELENNYRRESRRLDGLLTEEKERKAAAENKSNHFEKLLAQKEYEAEQLERRLQWQKNRPTKSAGVCDWVEQHFCNSLVIHERARRMMKDTYDELDIVLLCDALTYLASEYLDMLNGVIDEAAGKLRCSRFYNRPFEVCRNSEESIQHYPEDYIIPYRKNGSVRNEMLIWHLRLGKETSRLLRIYFFYDKDAKKIVIGSMPKHLRVVSC